MKREIALWFGILIGPLALLTQQQLGFMIVPWACATGLPPYLWLVSLIALLITLGGAFVSWREWKVAGELWPDEGGSPVARSRFMAAGGLIMSLMFAMAIVAQAIPTFILSPCS
jgi:hypothetical protein